VVERRAYWKKFSGHKRGLQEKGFGQEEDLVDKVVVYTILFMGLSFGWMVVRLLGVDCE